MPAMTMRTRRPPRTAEPQDLGPVDESAFPDAETRRAIDGGAASERFHEVLAEGGTVLADGAMGTMLFASGLQFGDPPEVWNLTQPEVIRRILSGSADGDGVGLANVDARLRRVYGDDHGLVVETAPGAGTKASFRVPKYAPGVHAS